MGKKNANKKSKPVENNQEESENNNDKTNIFKQTLPPNHFHKDTSRVHLSKNSQMLTINVIKNTAGDFFFAFLTCFIGVSLTWNYIPTNGFYNILTALCVVGVFFYMGYSLIGYSFDAEIDKAKNEVRVIKKKFGRIESIKIGQADQLTLSEIISEKIGRSQTGYRLDFEFFSSNMGIFRIPSCDVYLLGEVNRVMLEDWEKDVRKFMGLREPPAIIARRMEILKKKRETAPADKTE